MPVSKPAYQSRACHRASARTHDVPVERASRIRGVLTAILFAVLMVLGGLTTSAQAALTAGLTTAAPSDTSAMAYSNFVIDSTFGADNDGVSPRSMQFDLPKGQLGAVMNATVCSDANFNADNCAASSKIGEVLVNGNAVAIGFINIDVAAVGGIYRLATTGTEAARIGIVADDPQAKPLFITGVMRLRSDYGITAYVADVPDRATADLFSMGVDVDVSRMMMTLYGRVGGGASGNGFMFNPGECTAATTVVRAYPNTNFGGTAPTASRSYTPTNCGTAPFNPGLAFNPNPSGASQPTAFQVVASNPYVATDAKVGSPFKTTVITLPDGVQLSGAANSDGTLVACTDAQFGYANLTPATCPAGSKVGTVAMDSPLVGVVPGDVYLAQPSTGADNLVRLFMVAQLGTAADAVRVKLLADVSIDPSTGKLITTLTNLPAQPVKSFTFTFRAGTNPGTRQPRMCGTYAGSGALTSYSSATGVNRSANYVVTNNCPPAGRFRPTIGMTTTATKAGAFTVGTTTIDLPVGDEPMTKLTASLPAGMIANISGVTRCTIAQASADNCAAGTAVGTVASLAGQSSVPGAFSGTVYLTDAPDSQSIAGLYIRVPVQVGPIVIDTLKIQAGIRLRSDFGIDVVSDIPETLRKLNLDLQRLQLVFNKANFLVNPPVCSGNSVSGAFTSSLNTTATNSSAISVTGCTTLAFAPTLSFSAAPASAGGASSFTASVAIPASTSGNEQSAPKTISITLPDGVSPSPSASSDGSLAGCSDAQFTKNDFADPTCPSGSNVGTVSIQTPSVGALTGTAYLGTAVAGHTARLLVDATSTDFGDKARVKLEGFIDVNASTGKVTTVFDDLPKVQFTNFSLTLRGGTKPVLSMPRTCATYNGSSSMVPWSGSATATPSASITLTQNCADASSFSPTFTASVSPTTAGVSTALTTQVDVPERHRPLDSLALSLPAGLLANVDGLPRCTIAAANAGTCAASTKIGTVDALAGQGTTPGTFTGELFLTDAPAAGDVVGIAVKLPAVVGPVDLGDVITIASVKLRPSDYGINVTATIPTSQKGVPLHLRRLRLNVNKSGFLTNPLTCGATTIGATLTGTGGSTVSPTVPYQATGCASLGFNPSVSFSASPSQAAGASAFTTTITAPAGTDAAPQAALKKAVVDLPTGVSLSASINSAGDLAGCTSAQFTPNDFADPTCATGSAIGTATINVPQVGALTGNVYLAQTAPSGAIAGLYLDAKSPTFGSAVRVKLTGQVDVDAATGKTTATFDNAPAIAFTSFQLALRGGTKPAISVPRTCGTTNGAAVLTPQSGSAASRTAALTLNAGCGNDASFTATGSVTLGNFNAGADTSLTTVVNVPSGHRELSKVKVSLPPGLLANIQGKSRCTVAVAQAGGCAAATEIGTVSAEAGQGTNPGTFTGGKVYLVDAPSSGDVVGLGISIPVQVGPVDLGNVNVVGSVKLRDDYGIDITADVPTAIKGIPMYLRKLTIAITKTNFLFNPSTCGNKTASLTMTSASYAGSSSTANDSSTGAIVNCTGLAFDPSIGFSGSPAQAGGASSFTASVSLPAASAQSAVKQVDMDLPTGVSLSPSANSDGNLVGCTDAQFDLATTSTTPACPAASKIGSVSLMTSSVGQLTGDAFIASTAPGKVARVFVHAVAVDYPSVHVKLTGSVDSNAGTGVASASFTGLPEVPFTAFAITFRGGTNPVISMPRTCGTPTGSASLTGHAGNPAVTRTATLTVDQQCADATSFAPTFTNAISPTTAGVSTTLTSTVNIPQRHRALDQLTLSLPAGLLANIDGLARCSIANANAGTCAAGTKIGSVTAKAGQGTAPGSFNGSLYLTDAPSSGDVVGIAVALPAVVGPVDLGTITTIASVKLRPSDYGIDVVAAVPTSVKGIPLHLQQLRLTVDKANFLTNPTSCAATNTTATMRGQGSSATVSANAAFAATNCAGLGFNPQVAFSGSPAQAAGASAFTTTITAPAGTDAAPQGALKKAVVDLPTGVSLSPSINSDNALAGCTAAQFSQSDFSDPTCATGSAIGTATINVPQVGSLSGNVYLANTTPSGAIAGLYVDAKSATYGSAVRVKIDGKVDVDAATGKTTATFDNLPQVAFTSFQLALRGGTKPAISMPRVCGTPSGSAALTPQTGSAVNRTATLTVNAGCGSDTSFGASGSVSLSDLRAGQDTNLTTTVTVPSGHRELSKLAISLPAGLLAKIDGLTRCSVSAAQAGTCAAATEIGTVSADAGQGTTPGTFAGKVYLVDAPTASDMVGLGLSIPVQVGPVDLGKVNVVASVKLRSDYGIDITADVPTSVKGIPMYLRGLTVNVNKAGFLFNPSTCATRNATLALTSASYAGSSSTANASSALTFTQCASLGFNPSVSFSATPPAAGGAGSFATRITLPSSPAQAALKRAVVQLPAGVSLSPSIDSAGNLTGCSDAQFDSGTPFADPTCPAASKIGDLAIQTGTVGPLTGGVYLAATAPGHLARVFAFGRSTNFPGAGVKLTGFVDVDASTGIATADFSGAPEVPFTQFDISFRGGTSPALTLPRTCGTPAGSASLTSHADATAVNRSGTLSITQNCTSGFTPTVAVSSSPSTAAAATALTTTVTVPASSEELSRVRISLPAGLIAKIDGHAKCTIASANAGTCQAAAKIGVISAKAGQGTTPATFGGGSVYLTDAPTTGDLVGLAVELPVKVGSVGGNAIVDLGKVTAVGSIALRSDYGIDIDMPVPTQLKGIPIVTRQLTLAINESGFMVNPPTCTGNAVTGTLNSAQSGSAAVNTSLTVSGCSGASFTPSVSFSASPNQPATPSAFTTQLTLPSGDQAPVKKAVVTLPAGVSLTASADATGGLVGCADADFKATTWADPACPSGSKVGTVALQTPSVGALTGDVYLAATAPNGSIARVFLDATSTTYGSKARVKAVGSIAVDASTGATTATFDDLPPVAFSTFAMTLRGGSAPVVSLPRTCGSYAGQAVLTPHAGAASTKTGSLALSAPCPQASQFGPKVALDLTPNGAGANGTLTTTIMVPAGDQELSHLKLNMPEGLTAKLTGFQRCSIADAQNDACAPATRLGSVTAQVGVPGTPYTQTGDVYLTDGRSGNVAGMAIVLPAKVGPIDLGKVITIADVQLHSPDLALEITADVPTSVKGVRLDVRRLEIKVDKPGFIVNPSACTTLNGSASFRGKDGATATDGSSVTIDASSCASQTFEPQIEFSAGNPKPGQASDFTADITIPSNGGSASPFKSAVVKLPAGMSLSASAGARGDLEGCTNAQFHQDDLSVANTCPAGSEIGNVLIKTALVGDLVGKAYLAPATNGNLARVFMEGVASDVPNLTVRLIGEVQVDPATGITTAVFDDIPAIPVTQFKVTFRGGTAPVLALPRLCGTATGSAAFTPVNGTATKNRVASLQLNTDCPDANAFSPTMQLDRSNTSAGQSMAFTTRVDVPGGQQELSKLALSLPAGLLGKISSVPACDLADAKVGNCTAASKIGTVTAQVGVASAPFTVSGGAFLVEGTASNIARLALVLRAKVGPVDLGDIVTIADLKLRGDYGLDITADDIPTTVKGVRIDLHRFELTIDKADFMVNPVSCDAATANATLRSAQGGSQQRSQGLTTTDCDKLTLNASLGYVAAPASPLSASRVTTQIRASADSGKALDALKSVRVTMPEGLSLSPSAGARGDLAECHSGEFNASDISVDAACPAGSKVGSVVLSSPMVGQLSGDVFLGPKADGHFAQVFFQAKAADYPSLRVKIAGSLDVDANTGRLTAAFAGLPQVQVSSIDLTLRGDDAPVLSLPRTCGTFGADVNILRYGGATSDATGSLTLDQDCPDANAFAPSLDLAASNSQAGANTALTATVKVPARQQELTSMNVQMPAGLLGRLTVAPQCGIDEAKADRCGAESQIGTVDAKVGIASAPFAVQGKVYLTKGWDGSIAGLMFALPAKVGPIDLGTVVTMAQIKLEGADLRMRIVAGDIPTRVQGIPLNLGELSIKLDRDGLIVNPSTCATARADASYGSAQGGAASGGADYGTNGCNNLNWQPGLKVGFSGPAAELAVKGHPTISTVITQTEGQGNLRSAKVTLPAGIAADTTNINKRVCASAQTAADGGCPATSVIGTAEIVTSALPEPVNGDILIVKIPGAALPGVMVRVRDQISLDMVGASKVDSAGRLLVSFDGIPDTPISKMTLVFNGGSTGVIQVGTAFCGVSGVKTDAVLAAAHGATKTFAVPVDCNGAVNTIGGQTGSAGVALASATFRPDGSSTALTFALSNPNGIKKIVIKMPRGAIFTKKASKLVKLSLTGDKARVRIVNGDRRIAISLTPTEANGKVTKVKFKLPKKAIKINIKVRKVLENKKTSKKKKAKLLTKLLSPEVTTIDGLGATAKVKLKTAFK